MKRGILAVVIAALVSSSAIAAPAQDRDRLRDEPIMKRIIRLIKHLPIPGLNGDDVVPPKPEPKP
jgi:hypothetical protein